MGKDLQERGGQSSQFLLMHGGRMKLIPKSEIFGLRKLGGHRPSRAAPLAPVTQRTWVRSVMDSGVIEINQTLALLSRRSTWWQKESYKRRNCVKYHNTGWKGDWNMMKHCRGS